MTIPEYAEYRQRKLEKVKELSKDITSAARRRFGFESIAKANAQKILTILAEVEEAAKTLPEIIIE